MADAIIEAAAHVLRWQDYRKIVEDILAAVTPLIEAAALERAAQVAMDCDVSQCDAYMARRDIAVAIHALKLKPADELDRHTLMGPPSDFNEL